MKRAAQRKKIRIAIARFWDGASAQEIIDTLLPDLLPYFEFEVSTSPQVVLYGPYAGEMPKGRYLKVFIGCENVRPIMRECDWALWCSSTRRLRRGEGTADRTPPADC